ncbi:MAG: CoA transferase [Deltaproteobacteria bacterium]|nr:CoA transferase [Deltaproteobacteria bacterium]MBW2087086.1 CoA transferase [Deltaproteobacteria bacterium]
MAGPLEGIRVLSFGRALSGPFASMLLADLGAEVIKIEATKFGDFARGNGPFIKGIGSYFLSINRGKKSITLNLKAARAKKIVFKLVEQMDIVLENFRPGVMDSLGLGYEAMRSHNPKIIYASISGFGQTGPYAQRPAYDMIAQGMGGVVSITGNQDEPPVRVGYSIGDMGASLFAALAVCAALYERERSGEGQQIDVAMMDSQVALCENACARYFASGEIPKPLGSRHPLLTPFQIFPTRDGHIILIAFSGPDWTNFCHAASKEEWITDEKVNTIEARLKNYNFFEKEMNDLMRTRTTKEWLKALDEHSVMCGPVNSIEEVVNDPHVQAREMIQEVTHSRAGKLKVVGTPMKFSRTPCQIEKASPDLGEHTEEIALSLLGLSEEELETLRKEGVI